MLTYNAHIPHWRGEAAKCWHSSAVAKCEEIHVSHLEERFNRDFTCLSFTLLRPQNTMKEAMMEGEKKMRSCVRAEFELCRDGL
jgi:hypothetical protein